MSSEEYILLWIPEKLYLFDFSSLTICPISFSSDVGPIEQIQAIDDNQFIMVSQKRKFSYAIQIQLNKKEQSPQQAIKIESMTYLATSTDEIFESIYFPQKIMGCNLQLKSNILLWNTQNKHQLSECFLCWTYFWNCM